MVCYCNLAEADDVSRGIYGKALAILKKLNAKGRPAPVDEKYIAGLVDIIAKLPPE